MRSFVALDLSERVRSELASIVATFRKHGADVKWVEPENLHLTLKFLGEIGPDQVDDVGEKLRTVAGSFEPFRLRLATLGGFPDLTRPQVIWVGADEGKLQVERLAGQVDSALQGCGMARESRPFQVHLTLGRVKGSKNLSSLLGEIKWMTFSSGHRFEVDHMTLYKSITGRKEPIYEPVEQFALKK